MLIRREDFGNIEDLTKGSQKKVWFTCDSCNIGVLQAYSTYLKQKYGKFCRVCRNKHTMNLPDVKNKMSKKMKSQWKDQNYRKKMSISLSKGCKKAWDRDDGTRKKLVSENTSKGLKKKWNDKEFYEYQVKIQKKSQNLDKVKNKKSKKVKELWKNEEYRKRQIESKKGKGAYNKYTIDFIRKEAEKSNTVVISQEYINAHSKIKFKCHKNHIYEMKWNGFQQGHRCPKCSNHISKSEMEIKEYLKSLNINIIENNRSIIHPLELDIVIHSHKLAIEYCGLYWHSEENGKDKNYHLNKLKKCNQLGYSLIQIFEDEWINKQKIVKNRLKHILGLEKNKIYARKCLIRSINSKEARIFVENNHIQGYSGSHIKLGAFYNNELTAVMTFSKPSLAKGRKNNNDNIYEISRFCTNKNVIGIASKLLKYFQRNYKWKEIYSYADRRWSKGDLYEKIGMIFIKNTKPNYWYRKNNQYRYHRFHFRKSVLKNKLEIFDPNKSEYENMIDNGWNRIWDCGNSLYRIKN